MNIEKNDMQAVIDAVRTGMHVQRDAQFPTVAFLPSPEGLRVVDMEKHLGTPVRSRGTVTVYDPASFNSMLTDLGATQEQSAIFVDKNPNAPAVVAIIDYDTDKAAAWREHRVQISFRTTPEWETFMAANEKPMSAIDFANFIEDNAPLFSQPDSSHLMQVVKNFEVASDNKFSQAIRLEDGSIQLKYEENPQARVAGGTMAVPQEFTVGLKPFQGSKAYGVKAMFRWRTRDGNLRFFFKLLRTDDVVRNAVDGLIEEIEKGTNISVYEGSAPASTRGI